MDAFVARQPILGRGLEVRGYELLCRDGRSLTFGGGDGAQATSRVLASALHGIGLDRLTSGQPAYVNFPRELIVEGYPLLLPPQRIVVEILEEVEPDEEVLAACRRLKAAGYRLALDDVTAAHQPPALLGLADIVKVDFVATTAATRRELARAVPDGATLLAEKVERAEEFREAIATGYDLFQGFFFCAPTLVGGYDVEPGADHTLALLQLLGAPELDLDLVEQLVRTDLSLCYRLLRYLNSAAFSWRARIDSVGHALVLLGEDGVRRWLWVSALAELGSGRTTELLTTSAVRAWLCESLGAAARVEARPLELFLVGMLSLLDVVLARPLETVLDDLGVSAAVAAALLRRSGALGEVLAVAEAAERAEWPTFLAGLDALGVTEKVAATCYRDALATADALARC